MSVKDNYLLVSSIAELNGQETYDYYFAKAIWREAIEHGDAEAYVIETTTGHRAFG